MTKFKISVSPEVRGVSVHNDLKSARYSQKKHGRSYKIFRFVGKEGKGYWEEMR